MPTDTRIPGTLALLCALVASPAAQESWSIDATPDWVRATELSDSTPEAADYALIDYQANYVREQPELFHRWVMRFADERSIQEGSQLEILFDPTYQRLTLHEVKLLRGERVIDQLDEGRIRVIQRQTELDYQIYDGTHSLLLFLEDVRKGDAVDYSYTLTGANPAFGPYRMGSFPAAWGVPVDEIRYRVLWPDGRPLHVHLHGESPLRADVAERDGHTEYTWRGTESAYSWNEGEYPSWYDPHPWIQLSDFADWGEVARLGLQLFTTDPSDPAVAETLRELREGARTDEERVLRALRFVQDEIRYLGIEIGEGCFQPNPPALVLQRRFGDCKDKSLLLVSLLRGLGIEAYPVFVNTYYREHVARFHPSALAFNHAIVTARVDGETYWFDPTRLVQRGTLDSFRTAPYGRGLVIEEGATTLTDIPQSSLEHPATTIHQRLLLSLDEPVELSVVTKHVGATADSQRAELQGTDIELLGREYTEYYARLYPSIEQLAAPIVVDDAEANEIVITERYAIPGFWIDGEASLLAQELTHYFDVPSIAGRTGPLAAAHPVHMRYVIDARIEDGWDIEPESRWIETPAGTFSFDAAARGKRLRLEYSYRSAADHVPAGELAELSDRCDEIQELLEYPIAAPSGPGLAPVVDALNWPVLLTGLFTLLLGSALLVLIAVYNPRMPLSPPADAGPSGFGGWLVPVMVVVLLAPLYVLGSVALHGGDFGQETWKRLGDPRSTEYLFWWTPHLMTRTFLGTLTALCAFAAVPLFFFKRRSFALVFLSGAAIHVVALWVRLAGEDARDVGAPWDVAALLVCVALTITGLCYMLAARRVRNTFVH